MHRNTCRGTTGVTANDPSTAMPRKTKQQKKALRQSMGMAPGFQSQEQISQPMVIKIQPPDWRPAQVANLKKSVSTLKKKNARLETSVRQLVRERERERDTHTHIYT